MWQYKEELADLSFQYLFPADHQELRAYIASKDKEYRSALAVATQKIETAVSSDGWLQGRVSGVVVTGRTKSVHSTWKKIQRMHRRRHVDDDDCAGCASSLDSGVDVQSVRSLLHSVHDIVAMRIVLEPLPTCTDADEASLCYYLLGKCHVCWTPMPRTLKDYISSPKPNGYRSLHTTVLVGAGVHEAGAQPLEVQIRTKDMHQVAEYGAAAHWGYKSGVSLPWQQAIQRWQSENENAQEFMQLVRMQLLGTRVFVFTEKGRVLNLNKGASLADAAALLNVPLHGLSAPHYICTHNLCEPAGLDTKLSNGDIVCFAQRWGQGGHRQGSQPPSLSSDMVDGAAAAAEAFESAAVTSSAATAGSTWYSNNAVAAAEQRAADRASSRADGGQRLVHLGAHRHAHAVTVDLVVLTRDQPGALLSLTKAVTEHSQSITSVALQKHPTLGGAFHFRVRLEARAQVEGLLRELATQTCVRRVLRDSTLETLEAMGPASIEALRAQQHQQL